VKIYEITDYGLLIPEGATYDYESGNMYLGDATIVNDTWTFQLPQTSEDLHIYTAQVFDAADHVMSAKSSEFMLTIKTTPPDTYGAVYAYVDQTGPIQSGYSVASITDETRPGFFWPSASWWVVGAPTLYVDGQKVESTLKPSYNIVSNDPGDELPSGGTPVITPVNPLSEGTHVITYTLTDAAGNVSSPSDPFSITIDTMHVPDAPIIGIDTITGDDFVDASESSAVVISGTTVGIEDGQTVTLYLVEGKTDLSMFSHWSGFTYPMQPSFAQATAQVTGGVWATDPIDISPQSWLGWYGNDFGVYAEVSNQTGTLAQSVHNAVIDSAQMPAQIHINSIFSVNAEEAAALVISGWTINVEDGQTVTVNFSDSSGHSATATAQVINDSTTTWGPTWTTSATDLSGLTDGTINISASISNLAGFTDHASSDFFLDTIAPVAPTLMATDKVGHVTGPIRSGDITDDATPTFSGRGEPNAEITVYDAYNGGAATALNGWTLVQDNGTWSLTPWSELQDGPHVITVTATDFTGNESVASNALSFTIDANPITTLFTEVPPAKTPEQLITAEVVAPPPVTTQPNTAALTAGQTDSASRIDLSQLLTGDTQSGMARDGAAAAFSPTPLAALNDGSDLAALLLSHQVEVSHG
jgi:hypothetical protein